MSATTAATVTMTRKRIEVWGRTTDGRTWRVQAMDAMSDAERYAARETEGARLRGTHYTFTAVDDSRYAVTVGGERIAEGVRRDVAERLAALAGVAVDSGLVARVEDRRRGAYIVPDTLQWADWSDRLAVRCHGISVGDAGALTIAVALLDAAGDETTDYDTLYERAAESLPGWFANRG